MKSKIKVCLLLIAISCSVSPLISRSNSLFNWKSVYKNFPKPNTKLLRLGIVTNDNRVAAYWLTNEAISGYDMTLERSKNGTNFKKISQVDISKRAYDNMQFIETDYNPLRGVSYYRLKYKDNKNKEVYSNTVVVNYKTDKAHINSENRTQNNDELINNLKRLPSNEVLVVLRNIKGIEFHSKIKISAGASGIIGTDIENKLMPGTYLITGSSTNILYGQYAIIK